MQVAKDGFNEKSLEPIAALFEMWNITSVSLNDTTRRERFMKTIPRLKLLPYW
jgi:hypothetical protein